MYIFIWSWGQGRASRSGRWP